MAVARISIPAINNAIRAVCVALVDQCRQPPSWTSMSEDDLWRELVACILGSRVRFEAAYLAVGRLEGRHLFCQRRRSSHFQQYEQDVANALSGRGGTREPQPYPFVRSRASQIRQAAERLYGNNDGLRSYLENSHDIRDVRRRLATEVSGVGPKQASLFLRNIGYTAHIAVLDVHVLTYMRWIGLTEAPVKSVPTVPKYESLEDVFIDHATSLGYTPDCLDLAVWVVVRAVKEEQKEWE